MLLYMLLKYIFVANMYFMNFFLIRRGFWVLLLRNSMFILLLQPKHKSSIEIFPLFKKFYFISFKHTVLWLDISIVRES